MTNERPLVEGIEAYHQSLKEGARRERERILKLIDEKIHDIKLENEWGNINDILVLKKLKEELKK